MEQGAAQHQLQAPLRDGQESECLGHDLALLGDLDAAVDGARGQRRERPRDRRPSPATHRAAAAVEQRPGDSGAGAGPRYLLLYSVEGPRRGQQSRVLSGVGVAEHHFLMAPAGLELPAPHRVVEQRAHDARGVLQVVERLEQRDDVDMRARRLRREVHEPRLACEQQDSQQVVGGPCAGHDIRRCRGRSDLVLNRPHHPEYLDHPLSGLHESDARRAPGWARQLPPDGGAVSQAQSRRHRELC